MAKAKDSGAAKAAQGEKETGDAGGVAAVNRALSILAAFEDSVDGMTLTDLMNVTGLYHSTILRLCESLERFRYLKRLADGRYMLGPMPFYLGTIYQSSFHLRDYALPVLRELSKQSKETSAIYIREGNERICLHRVELARRVRMNVQEGDRVELDKGAAGKVLLAFGGEDGAVYEEVRQLGYSVSLAERDSGIRRRCGTGVRRWTSDRCSAVAGCSAVQVRRSRICGLPAAGARCGAAVEPGSGGDASLFDRPVGRPTGLVLPVIR